MALILNSPLRTEVIKIMDSEIPNLSCVSSDEHAFKMICIIYYRSTTRWQNSLLHIPRQDSLAWLSEQQEPATAASAWRGNDMGHGYSFLEVRALIKTSLWFILQSPSFGISLLSHNFMVSVTGRSKQNRLKST